MARRGFLLILSSPSGAGKSTLTKRLMAWDPTIRFSVSATTRAPRPGEVDGRDYFFRVAAGVRGAWSKLARCSNMPRFSATSTASPRAPVEAAMSEGRDTVFDIDWQGGQQIKQAMRDDVVSIFILPPSLAELERRLRSRGQDSDEVIAGRMAKSRDEISHWAEYDYVLVNRDLDRCRGRAARNRSGRTAAPRPPARPVRLRPPTEPGVRRQMIYALDDLRPVIDADTWVAPDANIIGKVVIEAGASVWFGATLRGDNEEIRVGAGSNVQENCVLHTDMGYPLTIGANCTIGHKAMLHGCTIGEGTLIGMGATLLNGCTDRSGLPDRGRGPDHRRQGYPRRQPRDGRAGQGRAGARCGRRRRGCSNRPRPIRPTCAASVRVCSRSKTDPPLLAPTLRDGVVRPSPASRCATRADGGSP